MRLVLWLFRVGGAVVGWLGLTGLPEDVQAWNTVIAENGEQIRVALVVIGLGIILLTLSPVRAWLREQIGHRGNGAATTTTMIGTHGAINAFNSTINITVAPLPHLEPEPPVAQTPPEAEQLDKQVIYRRPDGTLLIPNVIRNHRFRITDLPLGVGGIIGQEFEDCEIHGPAVIVPDGTNVFDECTWEAARSIESLLWEVPAGKTVVGALALTRCTFRRCKFRGVGIAGAKPLIDAFRAAIEESQSNSDAISSQVQT